MHLKHSLLRFALSCWLLIAATVTHAAEDYQGKVAIITGSSHGLGLELAKIAAEKKMKLVLADIRPEGSKALAESIKKNGAKRSSSS